MTVVDMYLQNGLPVWWAVFFGEGLFPFYPELCYWYNLPTRAWYITCHVRRERHLKFHHAITRKRLKARSSKFVGSFGRMPISAISLDIWHLYFIGTCARAYPYFMLRGWLGQFRSYFGYWMTPCTYATITWWQWYWMNMSIGHQLLGIPTPGRYQISVWYFSPKVFGIFLVLLILANV